MYFLTILILLIFIYNQLLRALISLGELKEMIFFLKFILSTGGEKYSENILTEVSAWWIFYLVRRPQKAFPGSEHLLELFYQTPPG